VLLAGSARYPRSNARCGRRNSTFAQVIARPRHRHRPRTLHRHGIFSAGGVSPVGVGSTGMPGFADTRRARWTCSPASARAKLSLCRLDPARGWTAPRANCPCSYDHAVQQFGAPPMSGFAGQMSAGRCTLSVGGSEVFPPRASDPWPRRVGGFGKCPRLVRESGGP
jgi:hypothetical protein